MSWNTTKSNTTPHNHQVVFGRRVDGCPRCAELKAGAPACKGWGWQKKENEARTMERIREHFAPGGRHQQITAAGGVDTAFEW